MQANEDYPLSAVPLDARKSIWSTAFMVLGFTLYSGTFFAGGLVGPAYRFWDLVGLMIVGNLILGSYAAALAYIATPSGNAIALRPGSRGAWSASLCYLPPETGGEVTSR